MKKIRYFLLLLLFPMLSNMQAQSPTWADDIACIVYNNCVTCHRTGGVAPFSLLDYTMAYNFRNIIQHTVNERIMPPFPADETLVDYHNEKSLTDEEIDLINAWIDAGAPEGDPTETPETPEFAEGDILSNPDLSVRMPTYESQAIFTDDYRCFVIPSSLTEDKYITGFEVVPGNRSIVHHVLVYADNTDAPILLDDAYPGPGYTCFGGPGSSNANLIGGWVPGIDVNYMPDGFGIKIEAGANIIIQTHYPEGSEGQLDSTKINFIFSDNPGEIREAFMTPILHHEYSMTNGPLIIPANQTRTFNEEFTVFANATMFGVLPHMHLIGRSIKVDIRTSNSEIIPVIDIPVWDFEWQLDYRFNKPIIVTFGSTVRAEAFYDNTGANPYNPNHPPEDVSAGEATTDEMMIVFFTWALYEQGDELLYFDDSPPIAPGCLSTSAVELVPDDALYLLNNPVEDVVRIENNWGETSFSVFTANGQRLQSFHLPMGQSSIQMGHLSPGTYYLHSNKHGWVRRMLKM